MSFNDGYWIYENCNANSVSNSDWGHRDYEWPAGTSDRRSACLATTGVDNPSWSTFTCTDIETWFVEF